MSTPIIMPGNGGFARALASLACLVALSAGVLGNAVAAQPQVAQNATASPLPAPPPPEPAAAGTPATVIDGQQIESLLGKTVDGTKGENMGRITDVLVDKKGQIRAAVVDFGGFFGVGSRKVAIDWKAIRFDGTNSANAVVVDMPSDQLRVAPIYKEGEPVVILGTRPAAETEQPVAGNPAPKPP